MTRAQLTRLRHLVAAMMLEENEERARSVPSSFTLLKAEFGFTGNRREVLLRALTLAKEEPNALDDSIPGQERRSFRHVLDHHT